MADLGISLANENTLEAAAYISPLKNEGLESTPSAGSSVRHQYEITFLYMSAGWNDVKKKCKELYHEMANNYMPGQEQVARYGYTCQSQNKINLDYIVSPLVPSGRC